MDERNLEINPESVQRLIAEQSSASLYIYKRVGKQSIWRLNTRSVLRSVDAS